MYLFINIDNIMIEGERLIGFAGPRRWLRGGWSGEILGLGGL